MKALYHPAHLTIQANALSRATQARAHRFLSDTAEAGIAAKDGLSCARPEIVDPPRASAAAPANDAPAAAVADGAAAVQGEEAGAGDSAAPVANDGKDRLSPSSLSLLSLSAAAIATAFRCNPLTSFSAAVFLLCCSRRGGQPVGGWCHASEWQ